MKESQRRIGHWWIQLFSCLPKLNIFYDNWIEICFDVWEVKSQLSFKRRNNESVKFALSNITSMHRQKTEFLALSFFLEFLVIFEKSLSCSYNLILVNAPKIFKVIDDMSFFIQRLKNFVISNIVKTKNTITDSCWFVDFNPTDFTCIVTMSSAASLDINSFNIHNSDGIAWDNTSLIKVESMLRFSLFLTLEVFMNRMTFQNNSVSLVLNFHLFFFSNRSVMSDV